MPEAETRSRAPRADRPKRALTPLENAGYSLMPRPAARSSPTDDVMEARRPLAAQGYPLNSAKTPSFYRPERITPRLSLRFRSPKEAFAYDSYALMIGTRPPDIDGSKAGGLSAASAVLTGLLGTETSFDLLYSAICCFRRLCCGSSNKLSTYPPVRTMRGRSDGPANL